MIKSEPVSPPQQSPLMVVKGLLLIVCFFFGAFGTFFFIWKDNLSAATSCVVMEVVCVLLLHLTVAVQKGKLREKFNETRLKVIFILAVIIGVAELVSSISYAALGTMNKQDFQIEDHGYYVAMIPSSLACIWAFILAYESRIYMLQFASTTATTMAQF